jgi:hypothetical protein
MKYSSHEGRPENFVAASRDEVGGDAFLAMEI